MGHVKCLPSLAIAIATCDIHLSAVDDQVIPPVANEVSKPLYHQPTLTFALTGVNLLFYHSLIYWLLHSYAGQVGDILTTITVLWGVTNNGWMCTAVTTVIVNANIPN